MLCQGAHINSGFYLNWSKSRCEKRNVRSGSVADPHDIPKAAVRAAGIGGKADLAIHRKQPFVSGKFRKATRELERRVLAETHRLVNVRFRKESIRTNVRFMLASNFVHDHMICRAPTQLGGIYFAAKAS